MLPKKKTRVSSDSCAYTIQLVANFVHRRPGINPRPVRVTFFVNEVIFRRVFPPFLITIPQKNKIQLDATYYIIMLIMLGSTCFGHHYAHHQELTTIALVTHIGRLVLELLLVGG